MRFPCFRSGHSLTRQEIDAYCEEHRLALPEPLVRQLLEQNGCLFDPEPVVSFGSDDTVVSAIFGIGFGVDADELWWAHDCVSDVIPGDLLPFASDPGGNLFLVECTQRSGACPVWFWDKQRGSGADAFWVAFPSFDAFLAQIADSFDTGSAGA